MPEDLRHLLQVHFNLRVLDLAPLQPRAGQTWVGRAETSTGPVFLKRTPSLSSAGPAIALHLHTLGHPALAPIPTRTGNLAATLGRDTLLVFPYIAAPTLDPATLDEGGWQTLGRTLRAIHTAPVPPPLRQALETETFHPWGEGRLTTITSLSRTPDPSLPPAPQQLLNLWHRAGNLPADFFDLVRDQGRQALASNPTFNLVHSDFQRDNILHLPDNTFLVIDWDSPSWGPAERDLMFIPTTHRPAFETGYGPFPNHPIVLAYVQADFLLQELLDCAERLLFRPDVAPTEQQWALNLASTRLDQMRRTLTQPASAP